MKKNESIIYSMRKKWSNCAASQPCRVRPGIRHPAAQPIERLLRNHVILFARPRERGAFQIVGRAQAASGGIRQKGRSPGLFPRSTPGINLDSCGEARRSHLAVKTSTKWTFERGRVIASADDFYTWVFRGRPQQKPGATGKSAAVKSFAALLERSGPGRGLRLSSSGRKRTPM